MKKLGYGALGLLTACLLWAPGSAMAQQAGDAPATGDQPDVSVGVDKNAAPDAGSLDKAKIKERLTFLLSGYEYFPTRQDLDELASADVLAPMLLGMAQDEKTRAIVRLRSIDALGYYKDAATRDWLRGVASSPVEIEDGMSKGEIRFAGSRRHHAIMSLAKAGESGELETLERLLAEEKDLQIRLTVVSAIGKHTGKDGKALLTQLQAQETNPVMQRELRKHL